MVIYPRNSWLAESWLWEDLAEGGGDKANKPQWTLLWCSIGWLT